MLLVKREMQGHRARKVNQDRKEPKDHKDKKVTKVLLVQLVPVEIKAQLVRQAARALLVFKASLVLPARRV